MKLFSHFLSINASNTYLIGPDHGGAAILIDPGCFDLTMLELIEGNGFYISEVLITYKHIEHAGGLNTLLKIYDAQVIAGAPIVMGHAAQDVKHGCIGHVNGLRYEVFCVKGYHLDSRIYKIGPFLFTGDILSAGRIGDGQVPVDANILCQSLRETILTMDERTFLLPGHGPPSTIEAEKMFNPALREAQRPDE